MEVRVLLKRGKKKRGKRRREKEEEKENKKGKKDDEENKPVAQRQEMVFGTLPLLSHFSYLKMR